MPVYAKGWSPNSAKDIASVGFLKALFAKDDQSRFLPLFNDLDTIPNLDGQLLIGEKGGKDTVTQPIATFAVQIKTLPRDYSNKNKHGELSDYKYSCDTGAFYTALTKITMDPVLLLLVDTRNDVAYWKHLSTDLCVSVMKKEMQKRCTVYFNEEDAIGDLNEMHRSLIEIADSRSSAMDAVVLIRNENSDSIRNQLLDTAIELNRMIDNEYRFLKESLFPEVRQFGLALNRTKDDVCIKVYTIVKNHKGELVRQIEAPDSEGADGKKFFDVFEPGDLMVFIQPVDGFDPQSILDGFIRKLLERFAERSYLPVRYLSDTVLAEIVFFFLDTLAGHYSSLSDEACIVACFERDRISVAESWEAWLAMRDAELYFYDSLSLENPALEAPGALIIDPLKRTRSGSVKSIEFFERALREPRSVSSYELHMKGDFPYNLVESALQELSDRGISEIRRPWRKPEGKMAYDEYRKWGQYPQIYAWYTLDTYLSEFEKLVRRMQLAFRFAARNFSDDLLSGAGGSYQFFLEKTRDPRIQILHKCGKSFDVAWSCEERPEHLENEEFGTYIRTHACLDFAKAPLYAALEYFLVRELLEQHDIQCVLRFGEHIGKKFV